MRKNLAREMIRFALEPQGSLRERARRDPRQAVELLAPRRCERPASQCAPMPVEMLEHAKLVRFEAELGDADNSLRARARRGGMLVS